MSFINTILSKLGLKSTAPHKNIEDATAQEFDFDAQLICFKNGKLYEVHPTDQESWYDARYLITDGELYDLENIEDIRQIPIPDFSKYDDMMEGYGVTGSLDYVLRMKAGAFYNRNEKELCSACLWKATEMMQENESIAWQKSDFDRLINWLNELGMYEDAQKAKAYLLTCSRYQSKGSAFDSNARQLKDITFQHAKRFGSDLVAFHDYGSGCCAECAKMRGRVYSISGKNKKYPPLPEYAKIHGNFHSGCRCRMSLFIDGEETIFYKGKRVNAEKISIRPWIDDRDEREKGLYTNYLQNIQKQEAEAVQREEWSKKKGRDKLEYDAILEALPEIAPKSLAGYRRMKAQKTKNFKKIVNAAKIGRAHV